MRKWDYTFINLLNFWLSERQLDSCICFCAQSVAVQFGVEIQYVEEICPPIRYRVRKGGIF